MPKRTKRTGSRQSTANPVSKPQSTADRSQIVAVVLLVAVAVGAWQYLQPQTAKSSSPNKGRRKEEDNRPFSAYRIDLNEGHLPDPIEILRERYNMTVLSESPGPLVLQFEDFLTPKECEQLKKLGKQAGLARSTAGLSREVDEVRTSSTAWLTDRKFSSDRFVQAIEQKMSEAMNVPMVNMEHFQVLNYQVGQFYLGHHDYIIEQHAAASGPRLATFFVYLNDVEGGGGTEFTNLGFTAMPKAGRAVLWYNTVYNFTTKQFVLEERTLHEATKVTKGEK